MTPWRRRALRSARCMLLAAVPAGAQEATRAHGPVLVRRDAAVLGVALAGSVVLIGWDRAISDAVRRSPTHGGGVIPSLMDAASLYGDPGAMVLGAGLYLSGRLAHDSTRRLIGLRAVEAVVLSGVVTGGVKAITGRARPDESPGRPRDFVLGRGVGDREAFQSYPSGHATAAFAFAAAVDEEWRRLRPTRPRWVPAALYGVAVLTAASRVYRDRHWTSDVMLGSAIGYVGGRAVVRWHGGRP